MRNLWNFLWPRPVTLSLVIGLVIGVVGGKIFLGQEGGQSQGKFLRPGEWTEIVVPANKNWTDTGLEVMAGQRLIFRAEGGISLQRGNPIAYCGPDGYPMKTVQQPLKGENIGALIGKVVKLISIEKDEETGEEKRNEMEEIFYIGRGRQIYMPLDGHLYLGINEVVVGDNVGSFRVEIKAGR
jgi:hypothetical protein